MYFLPKAFHFKWIATVVSLLLCVYGVEIYQFRVLTESISTNWHVDKLTVAAILLVMIIAAGAGGVKTVGKICGAIMPTFLVLYIVMSLWVILQNASAIPGVIGTIFSSAFTGHAAIGGFVGSTTIMAIAQGVRIGCYSGDIGIGYASVIQSESSTPYPEKQAGLTIFGIFLDTFVICTLSVLLVLVTGAWSEPIDSTLLVQSALSKEFHFTVFGTPALSLFMPFFLFLLGYSTIIAYFCVGLKCARFLSPKYGQPIYYVYAMFAFIFFSFFDLTQAYAIMTLAGGLLLILNLTGAYLLRKQIQFFASDSPRD
jgi:AGCS family alanine or glycine:cation symporter